MTLETGVKELAEAVGADVKALEDGKVDSTDSRLTDSREWSEETVAQEEAEAGTASTRRAWTAQRVRQAINSWWQLVTSGFGRNFIAASNEQAARNVLQLTYPATAPTVGDGVGVLREGAYGFGARTVFLDHLEVDLTDTTQFISLWEHPTFGNAAGVNLPYANAGFSSQIFSEIDVTTPNIKVRNKVFGAWTAPVSLYHTGNMLNIGTTSASARTALELVGEWVDLRPYLKSGFYFDSARNGRNSHPRIRKLSCGRVELDGVLSFNETSGPINPAVFVNVPSEFRPTLTAGGLMFGDTVTPLSFGAVNWIVSGQVEYSPPRVHGDIMMIPLTLTSPSQGVALSLNGIYWFT